MVISPILLSLRRSSLFKTAGDDDDDDDGNSTNIPICKHTSDAKYVNTSQHLQQQSHSPRSKQAVVFEEDTQNTQKTQEARETRETSLNADSRFGTGMVANPLFESTTHVELERKSLRELPALVPPPTKDDTTLATKDKSRHTSIPTSLSAHDDDNDNDGDDDDVGMRRSTTTTSSFLTKHSLGASSA